MLLTFFIARWSSALLERRLANRRHIDPGLRYTICSPGEIRRYHGRNHGGTEAGVCSRSHFDSRNLYGAVSRHRFWTSVLAADIASGFILLFERPIRIGDRITIGDDEGDVQSINLRTTVVTTNDRIAIIVPNSKLVGQRVINWSYGDPRARISIPIGVADDSDIQLVTETLIGAAKDVDNVLIDPRRASAVSEVW